MMQLKAYIFIFVGLLLSLQESAKCQGCIFPADLRHHWTRSRDDVILSVTDTQITGLNIRWNSQRMNIFDCHLTVGDNFILNTSFSSWLGVQNFFTCWSFVRVTASAFLLYELSDTINSTSFDSHTTGYVQASDVPLETSKVCTTSTSTAYFTTLIKEGATQDDIATTCPSQLIASFNYTACPTTVLSFCQNGGKVGLADYSLCSVQLFHSISGHVTCMTHVTRNTEIFLNLFTSGRVICFRLPNQPISVIRGVYYSGDCTTIDSGGSTSITLTKTGPCPNSTLSTVSSTSTTITPLITSPTASNPTILNGEEHSKGNDSVTLGIAAGLSAGFFALVLLVLLLILLIWRQKLVIKISGMLSRRKKITGLLNDNKITTSPEVIKLEGQGSQKKKRNVLEDPKSGRKDANNTEPINSVDVFKGEISVVVKNTATDVNGGAEGKSDASEVKREETKDAADLAAHKMSESVNRTKVNGNYVKVKKTTKFKNAVTPTK